MDSKKRDQNTKCLEISYLTFKLLQIWEWVFCRKNKGSTVQLLLHGLLVEHNVAPLCLCFQAASFHGILWLKIDTLRYVENSHGNSRRSRWVHTPLEAFHSEFPALTNFAELRWWRCDHFFPWSFFKRFQPLL